jgi:hypothetical protein
MNSQSETPRRETEVAAKAAPSSQISQELHPDSAIGERRRLALRLTALALAIIVQFYFKSLAHVYCRFFNRISNHYHVYSPQVWRERLSAAGFAVEEQIYYFSAAAHRGFDLSHYLGVPNLVTRCLFERWLRPYFEVPLPEAGAYQFAQCRK